MPRPKGTESVTCHKWTDEEKAYLKEITPGHHHIEIQQLMNEKFEYQFTLNQIKGAINRYKLNTGFTGYYEKGNIPFNKGKKQTEYMSQEAIERTKKTRFKLNNTPLNHRPVGSERVTVDGYIEVKVAEPSKWRLKHQVVWEKANGKTPKGYTIIFADQNRQNCSLDNLILVSRHELLIMNKRNLISEDAEITKIGSNVAKVLSIANKRRQWTEEEIEYLQEEWGFLSLNTLSSRLGRSKKAILSKLNQLEITQKEYCEYFSKKNAAKALGVSHRVIDKLIAMGLKCKKKKCKERIRTYIDPIDLKRFIKNNQDSVSFANMEPGALGYEEKWMKEKRKNDKCKKKTFKFWTRKEINKLIEIYPYKNCKQIAEELERTEFSVQEQINKLQKEGLLIYKITRWTKKEEKELIKLDHKGKSDKEISEILGKTITEVKSHRKMMKKKGIITYNKTKLLKELRDKSGL